jgi:hypothetical protein
LIVATRDLRYYQNESVRIPAAEITGFLLRHSLSESLPTAVSLILSEVSMRPSELRLSAATNLFVSLMKNKCELSEFHSGYKKKLLFSLSNFLHS